MTREQFAGILFRHWIQSRLRLSESPPLEDAPPDLKRTWLEVAETALRLGYQVDKPKAMQSAVTASLSAFGHEPDPLKKDRGR